MYHMFISDPFSCMFGKVMVAHLGQVSAMSRVLLYHAKENEKKMESVL